MLTPYPAFCRVSFRMLARQRSVPCEIELAREPDDNQKAANNAERSLSKFREGPRRLLLAQSEPPA